MTNLEIAVMVKSTSRSKQIGLVKQTPTRIIVGPIFLWVWMTDGPEFYGLV